MSTAQRKLDAGWTAETRPDELEAGHVRRRVEEDDALAAAAARLFAGLQVRDPDMRTVLVTGIEATGAARVASALTEVAVASGYSVSFGQAGTGRMGPGAAEGRIGVLDLSDRLRLLDIRHVRQVLTNTAGSGMAVIATDDLMGDAESLVIAACVDGVIVVAEGGRTREQQLREARRQLDAVGARLIGSVYLSKVLP